MRSGDGRFGGALDLHRRTEAALPVRGIPREPLRIGDQEIRTSVAVQVGPLGLGAGAFRVRERGDWLKARPRGRVALVFVEARKTAVQHHDIGVAVAVEIGHRALSEPVRRTLEDDLLRREPAAALVGLVVPGLLRLDQDAGQPLSEQIDPAVTDAQATRYVDLRLRRCALERRRDGRARIGEAKGRQRARVQLAGRRIAPRTRVGHRCEDAAGSVFLVAEHVASDQHRIRTERVEAMKRQHSSAQPIGADLEAGRERRMGIQANGPRLVGRWRGGDRMRVIAVVEHQLESPDVVRRHRRVCLERTRVAVANALQVTLRQHVAAGGQALRLPPFRRARDIDADQVLLRVLEDDRVPERIELPFRQPDERVRRIVRIGDPAVALPVHGHHIAHIPRAPVIAAGGLLDPSLDAHLRGVHAATIVSHPECAAVVDARLPARSLLPQRGDELAASTEHVRVASVVLREAASGAPG